jgi:hypothetical protein
LHERCLNIVHFANRPRRGFKNHAETSAAALFDFTPGGSGISPIDSLDQRADISCY